MTSRVSVQQRLRARLQLRALPPTGAGPHEAPFTIDLDSTICETYGQEKAGGSRFCYTHTRGYHPLLAVAAGQAKKRRSDTLDQVLAAPDREQLLTWLRQQPMLHVEGAWVMVHAGLLPQWNIATAQMLAQEVETALRGANWQKFLAKLYGNTPDTWNEDLRGAERLRVIVNAMARMRFCTAEGTIEFRTKGETAKAPPGFFPWFDAPGRASRDHTLICGHWSTLGLKLRPDLVALDSGCVWGGSLSALRLEDRKLFQVPCEQCQVPGE